ncbi:hypothetical protein MRB53_037125 [Persea americana]|nr:hypothetical protein MRB53_037125 [Persea americana]
MKSQSNEAHRLPAPPSTRPAQLISRTSWRATPPPFPLQALGPKMSVGRLTPTPVGSGRCTPASAGSEEFGGGNGAGSGQAGRCDGIGVGVGGGGGMGVGIGIGIGTIAKAGGMEMS